MAQTSGGATGEEMVLMGLRAVRRCAVERCGKGDRTRRRGKEGRKEGRKELVETRKARAEILATPAARAPPFVSAVAAAHSLTPPRVC